MSVISQVMVLFILLLFGLFASKARIIDDKGIQGLNKLVVYFSTPCLVIAKCQLNPDPALMPELITVMWMGGLSVLLCGAIGALIFHRCKGDRRKIFIGMAMFSNAGFMGFPVLIAALGEENLIYGIMYVAVFNVLIWGVGVLIFDKKALSLKKIITVPSLLAAILGIILFAARIQLPAMILETLNMMGNITTPVAMFIVGARLSQLKLQDIKDGPLLLACVLRLLVLPLLILTLVDLLNAPQMVRATIYICTAMPCAAVLVMHAETYQGNAPLASRGVALSTALSMATVPLMLMLIL